MENVSFLSCMCCHCVGIMWHKKDGVNPPHRQHNCTSSFPNAPYYSSNISHQISMADIISLPSKWPCVWFDFKSPLCSIQFWGQAKSNWVEQNHTSSYWAHVQDGLSAPPKNLSWRTCGKRHRWLHRFGSQSKAGRREELEDHLWAQWWSLPQAHDHL